MKNYVALFACGLLTAAFMLSGCSKAGKCVRGELGCACKTDVIKRCAVGAVCVDDRCVTGKEQTAGTNGGGAGTNSGTGGRAGTAGKGNAGDSGSAGRSATGGSSADAGPVKRDGGGVDAGAVNCGNTFESACRGFCTVFCQEQQDLCLSSTCDKGSCEPGGKLYAQCAQVCTAGDAACVKKICMNEISAARTCENFGFLDDAMHVFLSACLLDDPQCVADPDYGCSDTCGTMSNQTGGDLANDGMCEDGGKGSTENSCPRGTDCTDCGLRTCSDTLGPCVNNGDCCGFYSHKSLCVKPDPNTPSFCLATCTDSGVCANGATCTMVKENNSKVCAPP